MNRRDFLKAVYHRGIRPARGQARRRLRAARDCFLWADDLKEQFPQAAERHAVNGLIYLESITEPMNHNEGFHILASALKSIVQEVQT